MISCYDIYVTLRTRQSFALRDHTVCPQLLGSGFITFKASMQAINDFYLLAVRLSYFLLSAFSFNLCKYTFPSHSARPKIIKSGKREIVQNSVCDQLARSLLPTPDVNLLQHTANSGEEGQLAHPPQSRQAAMSCLLVERCRWTAGTALVHANHPQ